MIKIQNVEQVVDVSAWVVDETYGQYPEGARDKTLLHCPQDPPFDFLEPNEWYLFKLSSSRYPEQFWNEIFAYRLGFKMELNVPPTFVAHDDKNAGALIKWFINKQSEGYVSGGDYCQRYIQYFDRKKGRQHNLETVLKIFSDLSMKYPTSHINELTYWAEALVFDALIGNTDRHQDNWGTIENPMTKMLRISPVFDNGTSMGHEILREKIHDFDIRKYVQRGAHHMRWAINDKKQLGHLESIKKLISVYPNTKEVIAACLNRVCHTDFEEILGELTKYDISVKLSPERAEFMLKLLTFRHKSLLAEL